MTPGQNMEICVIGIGNEHRGDDAAGLLAARRLRQNNVSGATVLELDGETTALMDAMNGCTAVILIDAMQSGDRIGAVTRFDAGTRPLPSVAFRCSTHAISVGETIELARALDKLPRHVIVYGIEGSQFEAGSAVSPALNQSLEETIERVTCEIQSLHTQLGIN